MEESWFVCRAGEGEGKTLCLPMDVTGIVTRAHKVFVTMTIDQTDLFDADGWKGMRENIEKADRLVLFVWDEEGNNIYTDQYTVLPGYSEMKLFGSKTLVFEYTRRIRRKFGYSRVVNNQNIRSMYKRFYERNVVSSTKKN